MTMNINLNIFFFLFVSDIVFSSYFTWTVQEASQILRFVTTIFFFFVFY